MAHFPPCAATRFSHFLPGLPRLKIENSPPSFLSLSLSRLKLECDKLASEKTEMQRHYVMVSSNFVIVLFTEEKQCPPLHSGQSWSLSCSWGGELEGGGAPDTETFIRLILLNCFILLVSFPFAFCTGPHPERSDNTPDASK